mmetsp:Transcript_17382/g.35862  ORF Transcript_17382/g.35862 Transcript_17382/m.35862 type:complete len:2102 (+) Transcript_17382:50-6355(+)
MFMQYTPREWVSHLKDETFLCMKTNRFGTPQRRKAYLHPEKNQLVLQRVGQNVEKRYPLSCVHRIYWSEQKTSELTMIFNAMAPSEDVDDDVKIPDSAMLQLSFRNRVEREMFSNAIHLCNHKIIFASDCQSMHEIHKHTLQFKCSSLNALGMASEALVLLNCEKFTIQFGDEANSPVAPIADIEIDPQNSLPKRLDISYPTNSENSSSIGKTILSQHEGNSKNMVMMSMSFASPFLKQRFLGRIRAMKKSFKGTDTEETLPLPSGETLNILTATWNVGEKGPPVNLEDWAPAGAHDIYAIGMQECDKKRKWFKALQDHLCGEHARTKLKSRLNAENKIQSMTAPNTHVSSSTQGRSEYVLLSVNSLWGIHLVIIVRSDLKQRITNLSSSTEATGIAHILGNKGGVATGIVIDKTTSLAFVTCHLAARVTRLHTRQENYEEIVRGLHIDGSAHSAKPVKNIDFLHQFDHVFWFGDLNYRIDMGSHGTAKEFKKTVKLALSDEARYKLQDYDQLRKQMHGKSVMCDFEEGAIDFAPTYRMNKGKSGYNNKKNQNPSYCDRVLWRSLPGAAPQLYQTVYSSAATLNQSDHRPVLAAFAMNTREPFVARTPITADGGIHGPDIVILSVTNLKYTVADDPSNPKAKRTIKFDGYAGPCVVSFYSVVFQDGYSSAPTDISNPAVATAFKKKMSKSSKSIDHGSESDATSNSRKTADGTSLENPTWAWDNRDLEDMFPVMSDCEWIATQSITAAVRRGTHAEAPVMGQCEIPLSAAFQELIRSEQEGNKTENEHGLLDDEDEDADAFSSSIVNGRSTRGTTSADDDFQNDDGKAAGAIFKSKVLKYGKFNGILSGRIEMTFVPGINPDEDEAEISDKLITLKRNIMGLREKRIERIAVAKEAPAPETVVKIKVKKDTILHEEEKKVDEVTTHTVEEQQKQPVCPPCPTDDVDEHPVEEPTLLRIGGKAKVHVEVINDSDNEDDEDDVGEDEEALGPEVWLEDDEVVARSGKRWDKADFVCQHTKENLLNYDFILKNDEPYSKVGYLQKFALDTLCAHCLKQCKKTQNCLNALGFKWHAEHLKCAHSGNALPISKQFLVKNKLPYQEESYLELFHTCPKCLSIVPIGADTAGGVSALNQIWHRDCFNCDSCGKDFPDGKFFSRENKDDGRGKMPYCEDCYKTNFMPRCMACKDHVLLEVDEVVQACGGYWHPEHFKCASTGALLGDEYISHDGLPYSVDGYFEKFGERCTKCGDVMREEIVHVLGQKWHPHCFVCTSSGKPIPKNEDGSYVYFAHELMPYCEEEYARLFGETCARCKQAIVHGGVEALGEHWHEECLTCQTCTRLLTEVAKGKPIYQGPEDGMPYCSACYGRKHGDVCAACRFPINPGEVPVEALGKVFHKQHFSCVKCHKGLYDENDNPLEFFPHEGFPFCRDCYLDWVCMRCLGCGNPIRPEDDVLTLQDGKGNNSVYHRSCHKCFITDEIFRETDTIYLNDGVPYSEVAYKEVFAEYMCAGCGDGIIGARQVALEKSWHPGCIGCVSCDKPLATNEIFIRQEPGGMKGGKWPCCQEHMMSKFGDLSEKGCKKLKGEVWSNWEERQSKAKSLNEEKRIARDSMMKERSASESSRSEAVRSTLASPFAGFEKQMREAMGIKTRRNTDSVAGSITSRASEGGGDNKKEVAELDREAKSWVELKDNLGYTYYWNTFTDNTTYDKPQGFEEAKTGGGGGADVIKTIRTRDGSVYSVHTDPNGAGDYYENISTGQTQWEPPQDVLLEEDGDEKKRRIERVKSMDVRERDSVLERASEWSTLTDDTSGHIYFENGKTGVTQWEKPEDLELLEGIKELEERGEESMICEGGEGEEGVSEGVTKSEAVSEAASDATPGPPSLPPPGETGGSGGDGSGGDEEGSIPGPPQLPPPAEGKYDREEDEAKEDAREQAKSPTPPPPPAEEEEIIMVNNPRRPSKLKIEHSQQWTSHPDVNSSSSSMHKSGYLKKKGSGKSFLGRRNWNMRYFVITGNKIGYWKSDKDFKSNQDPIKGSQMDLSKCQVEAVDTDKYAGLFLFAIKTFNKELGRFNESELKLLATSEEEREGWIKVIKYQSRVGEAAGGGG